MRLDPANEELQSSCNEVRAHADAMAEDVAAVPEHRGGLGAAVERHLTTAERALSPLARRALLRDHRRLEQLLRAVEFAADDGDGRAVAVQARRLVRFIVEHAAREREYIAAE